MRIVRTTLAVLIMGATASAQVAPPVGAPAPATQAPPPGGVAPVVPAPVLPLAPLGARTFTTKTGLIFQAVRPDRVVDFEMVIGYLQAALDKTTDARVREQAKGWRVFKSVEPGPNNTVLYVFVIDPAVAGADYSLGRILSDAYPDQIQEIWKLYMGSLAPNATLLNLAPVQPTALLTPPSSTPTPATPAAPPRPAPSPTP